MKIKPLTRNREAMMREGYLEPERAFTPPPTPILDGDLDDRAFEMLELMVWVFRISSHDLAMRHGIGWSVLQRWYDVGDSDEMRRRIYAGLTFLVADGYLREVGRTQIPVHPGLTSDHFAPTEKAFELVDRRQAPVWRKLWTELAERQGAVAALVAAIVAAAVTVGAQALQALLR